MRVLISTNIPAPYRWLFWNELDAMCDLTVAFESNRAKNRKGAWYTNEKAKFETIYLKHFLYGEECAYAPGMPLCFLNKKYDIKVLGGYSSVSDILTIVVMKLLHIRYILEIDGILPHEESWIKKKFKTFLIRGARHYLSPSKITDDCLKAYGVDENKIRRYHFTSLLEKDILLRPYTTAEKEIIRSSLGVKEHKVIVSVGSFIHRKGFDILLESMIGVPKDVGCYIVGGEPTEEYRNIVQKQRLENVHFIRHQDKQTLTKYYRAADFCVFPTRYDIWGLVVNEAMAQGLPVITTNQCGAGLEMVSDGENGYIVPTENADELRSKIIQMFSDNDCITRMAQASLDKAKEYTIERMVTEYHSLFDEMNRNSEG